MQLSEAPKKEWVTISQGDYFRANYAISKLDAQSETIRLLIKAGKNLRQETLKAPNEWDALMKQLEGEK